MKYLLSTLQEPNKLVYACSFNNDGSMQFVKVTTNLIYIYNGGLQKPQLLRKVDTLGHVKYATSVALNNELYVVSVTSRDTIVVYNQDFKVVYQYDFIPSRRLPSPILTYQDGDLLYLHIDFGKLHVLNIKRLQILDVLNVTGYEISAFCVIGDLIYTVETDYSLTSSLITREVSTMTEITSVYCQSDTLAVISDIGVVTIEDRTIKLHGFSQLYDLEFGNKGILSRELNQTIKQCIVRDDSLVILGAKGSVFQITFQHKKFNDYVEIKSVNIEKVTQIEEHVKWIWHLTGCYYITSEQVIISFIDGIVYDGFSSGQSIFYSEYHCRNTSFPTLINCGGTSLNHGYLSVQYHGSDILKNPKAVKVGEGLIEKFWVLQDGIVFKTFDGAISLPAKFSGVISHVSERFVVTSEGVYDHTGCLITSSKLSFVIDDDICYIENGYLITRDGQTELPEKAFKSIVACKLNDLIHVFLSWTNGIIHVSNGKVIDFASTLVQDMISVDGKLVYTDLSGVLYFGTNRWKVCNGSRVNLADLGCGLVLCYSIERTVLLNLSTLECTIVLLDFPLHVVKNMDKVYVLDKFNVIHSYDMVLTESKMLTKAYQTTSLVTKFITLDNQQQLIVALETTSVFNELRNKEQYKTTITVLNSVTLEPMSSYEVESGMVSDITTIPFDNDRVATYQDNKTSFATQVVLSSCFVCSINYETCEDDVGPVLLLFTIDEFGSIELQTSLNAEGSARYITKLLSHSNRLLITSGKALVMYQISYDSNKFRISPVSNTIDLNGISNGLARLPGDEILSCDITRGLQEFKITKPQKFQISHGASEWSTNGYKYNFVTNLASKVVQQHVERDLFDISESISTKNFIVFSDALNNISIFDDEETRFNLEDEVTSITAVENGTSLFLITSANGGIYLISHCEDENLVVQQVHRLEALLSEFNGGSVFNSLKFRNVIYLTKSLQDEEIDDDDGLELLENAELVDAHFASGISLQQLLTANTL